MSSARPIGYFLWGLAWLVIAVSVVGLLLMVLLARINGQLTQSGSEPSTGQLALTWIIGVPLTAWLFIVFPFLMLSQALMGFVASVLATRQKYADTVIVEFVGSARYKTMEARIDTPVMRLATAMGQLGAIPGWLFAISAMAITAGIGLVLTVPLPVATIAGVALVLAGAGGATIGIARRVNVEVVKPVPDKLGLTEKYYKGLRYREGKRARDLQKARDAGRAGDLDCWGRAEAEHALRAHPMSKNHARKGVPGALDAAISDVAEAMQIPRTQAEQYVIDAAAFRGKKPVPVSATG